MRQWPLPNVWIGTSVENQAAADERIPHLLRCPAAVRFLSVEPMLGPVDLQGLWNSEEWRCKKCEREVGCGSVKFDETHDGCGGECAKPPVECIYWVICGGESGAKARPMHPDWARSLRDQCQAAGVKFFFKQWGAWAPGEAIEGQPVRTEQTASWNEYGKFWNFGSLTPKASEEMHDEFELDVYRVGKKRAGRSLDGREWNEMPEKS